MTKTIIQKVEFKNVEAADLYSMFLSSEHHAKIRGGIQADISEVEGAKFCIDNGHLYGKILHLVKNRLLVLGWRSAGSTPKETDTDMIVVMNFLQKGKDALIELTQANVPEDRCEIINQSWEERYWIPWKKYLETLK